MEKFQPIKEIIREEISKCSDVASGQFRSSVRPIYGTKENCTPDHLGSCLLITFKKRNFIITAAHLIDQNKETTLYVGGASSLFMLEGNFFITVPDEVDRSNDHFDFAFKEISESCISEFKGLNFINENQISPKKLEPKGRCFMALGYPNSKNKKHDNHNKKVKPQIRNYSGLVEPDEVLAKKLNLTGKDHFFLSFNSKYSQNHLGQRVSSFKPNGLSGGGLFDLGNFAKPESFVDRRCHGNLAGLIIENHADFKKIVAVKSHTIFEAIQNKCF